MKFTLNDCISRINQSLNYPAVAYEDIYHFFDQAIAELNTNLRIALPSVTEMRSEHTFDVTNNEGLIRFSTRPTSTSTVKHSESIPLTSPSSSDGDGLYVCPNSDFNSHRFYKWNGSAWVRVPNLYGIYIADASFETYVAVPITWEIAAWAPVEKAHLVEFDLTEYLPLDWWVLFIIPYVCFKFAVRNGDSGELFVDEYTQGYQQLQSSYNVPNTVILSSVAGRPAYKNLVEQNLANLNTAVFTRAISEDMRVGNGIASVYGGFYETGGWI